MIKTGKAVTIEAMFPELKGGNIYKTGRGRASNTRAATTRALRDLFMKVKGQRFQVIKATITIVPFKAEVIDL